MTTIRCAFCETTSDVPVSEELEAFSDDLSAVHQEASMALLEVWEKQVWSARALALPDSIRGTIMMLIVVMGSIVGAILPWKLLSLGFLGLCFSFLGSAIVLMVLVSMLLNSLNRLSQRRKMSAYHEAFSSVQDGKPRRCQCPSCGSVLAIPGMALSLRCHTCQTPLVAAEGLLIERLDDAEGRRDHWMKEAGRLTDEIAAIKQHRHIAYEGPILALVLVLMLLLCFPLLAFVAS